MVIGNGFDKAHGLNTEYFDFLQWAYDNRQMGEKYGEHMGKTCIEGMYIKQQVPGFNLHEYWQYGLYDPNIAERYNTAHLPVFAKTLFKAHQSWIDLENNFASCLRPPTFSFGGEEHNFTVLNALFTEFLLPKFEQYIAEVINNVPVALSRLSVPSIDSVLSFNYSNTFERLYSDQYPNAKICYINGKAQTSVAHSNIVFGCDCFEYSEKGKDKREYDKAFQRALKNTCDAYKRWFLPADYSWKHIFIVGHSLGETDWNILRPMITAPGSITKVYYHTEDSRRELIYNMMGMVGKENLNQREISFRPISELITHQEKQEQ